MSIGNTSNLPPNDYTGPGTGSASSDVTELDALKSAFLQAMRASFGGGRTDSKNTSTTETLLDATEKPESYPEKRSNAEGENAEASETRRRKELDRAEIRSEQLHDDYTQRLDRRRESRETVSREEAPSSEAVRPLLEVRDHSSTEIGWSFVSATTTDMLSTVPEIRSNPPSPETTGGISVTAIPDVPFDGGTATIPGLSNVSVPADLVGIPVTVGHVGGFPNVIPSSVASTMSVLTIFTASGRFGPAKEDREKEENSGEYRRKEKSGFAALLLHRTEESNESSRESFASPEKTRALEKGHSRTELFSETEQSSGDFRPLPVKAPNKENSLSRQGISLEELSVTNPAGLEEDLVEKIDEAFWEAVRQTLAAPGNAETPPPGGEPAPEANLPQGAISERIDEFRFMQRLIHRVGSAMLSSANQGGTIRIKLNLDRLGPVTVRIQSRDESDTDSYDRLAIQFEATSPETARLLEEHVEELRQAVTRHDVKVDRIDVDISC